VRGAVQLHDIPGAGGVMQPVHVLRDNAPHLPSTGIASSPSGLEKAMRALCDYVLL
jgi:hypothetical protein